MLLAVTVCSVSVFFVFLFWSCCCFCRSTSPCWMGMVAVVVRQLTTNSLKPRQLLAHSSS